MELILSNFVKKQEPFQMLSKPEVVWDKFSNFFLMLISMVQFNSCINYFISNAKEMTLNSQNRHLSHILFFLLALNIEIKMKPK